MQLDFSHFSGLLALRCIQRLPRPRSPSALSARVLRIGADQVMCKIYCRNGRDLGRRQPNRLTKVHRRGDSAMRKVISPLTTFTPFGQEIDGTAALWFAHPSGDLALDGDPRARACSFNGSGDRTCAGGCHRETGESR